MFTVHTTICMRVYVVVHMLCDDLIHCCSWEECFVRVGRDERNVKVAQDEEERGKGEGGRWWRPSGEGREIVVVCAEAGYSCTVSGGGARVKEQQECGVRESNTRGRDEEGRKTWT